MKTTKRNYESLYVLDASLTDEQVDSIVDRYSALVTSLGGEVQAAGFWEKRRLAYEVKGRREGIYILMYFLSEPEVSKELDRNFRISDDIMRHLIVRVEPEHIDTGKIGRPQPTEAVESTAAPAEAAPAEPAPAAEAAAETAETPETPAAEAEAAPEPTAEQPAEETSEQQAPAAEQPAAE